MRIGIVTDNYFPSVGGTEISIWNYAKSLEQHGHTVFIFCPSNGRRANNINPQKRVVRLPSIRGVYPDHPLLFVYPGITGRFAEYELDILHSQTPITAPYVAEHISKKLNIPHVHTMHTLIPEQVKRSKTGLVKMVLLYIMQSLIIRSFRFPKNYLLQDEGNILAMKVRFCWVYMIRLMEIPDDIIYPSKHVSDIFCERGLQKKGFILPTFSDMFAGEHVDDWKDRQTVKPIRIIHVGRLDIEKRAQVIIDAVNVLPDYVHWELVIVGTGSQLFKLKYLVKKYKLSDKVIFKGRLSQKAIREELLQADIFVMTSYHFETQGIVLLEACAAGLAIVQCDNRLTVGVEPSNSILTGPHPWAVSKGLIKLLHDDALRERLGKGSIEVAKKYKSHKLTKRLVRFYRSSIIEYGSGE